MQWTMDESNSIPFPTMHLGVGPMGPFKSPKGDAFIFDHRGMLWWSPKFPERPFHQQPAGFTLCKFCINPEANRARVCAHFVAEYPALIDRAILFSQLDEVLVITTVKTAREYISNPTYLHKPICIPFMAYGVYTYDQKNAITTLDDVKQLRVCTRRLHSLYSGKSFKLDEGFYLLEFFTCDAQSYPTWNRNEMMLGRPGEPWLTLDKTFDVKLDKSNGMLTLTGELGKMLSRSRARPLSKEDFVILSTEICVLKTPLYHFVVPEQCQMPPSRFV